MTKLFFTLLNLFFFLNVYAENIPLSSLNLPKNFSIKIYAAPIENAREMTLGENNIVYVGSLRAGNVYAIIPDKNKPHGTRVITIAKGLEKPNGVAFYQGALFVADKTHILRFDNITQNLEHPSTPITVASLPNKSEHDWHYIAFGPDKKLYVGIGAPCNTCLSDDPRFATIMRMNPDGTQFEIFARGVRNTVGFDWNPLTHVLWFSDNSRDWMGDDMPPEELNAAPHKDMNFGFPFCYGKNTIDPAFNKNASCDGFTPALLELPAHVAPLGLKFYSGNLFPVEYKNQIFIAEHGSWNRSKKIGYQVMSVKLNGDKVTDVKPFVTGWLVDEKTLGRPVDLLQMPDGSLLISDDYANVIYQVTYKK